MRFPAVEQALDDCKRHLEEMATYSPSVEIFLVRYPVVLICAEFENAIEELIGRRADGAGDVALASYVKASTDRILRSIRISEISGLLGLFDSSYRGQFQESISAKVQRAYDSIVTSRHAVAHGDHNDITLTFEELYQTYPIAKDVIEKVAIVLAVST